MPSPLYESLRSLYRRCHRALLRAVNAVGLNVSRTSDYYSPLPVLGELERTRHLWDRPGEMPGVRFDLAVMKERLSGIVGRFGAEWAALPPYEESKSLGYGPGFTEVDALVLYCMLRHVRPRHFVEVGSGVSTYYAWLALVQNREQGSGCGMRAIDPFPRRKLEELEGVEIDQRPVQELAPDGFAELGAGDILFIDTTHVVKLGGDVPYLYLEVLPRLAPGVVVHAHDIHFPYSTPYPAEKQIFGAKWPRPWTEAMLLQAFLAFNREFEILLSTPLLRHFDEPFLARTLPDYRPLVVDEWDTHFSSIWLRRVQ